MDYYILLIECSNGKVLYLVIDEVDGSIFWTTDITLATRLNLFKRDELVNQIKDRSVDRPHHARTLTIRKQTFTDIQHITLA